MTGGYPKTSIADYLAGYVSGYWAGYDFAVDEPQLAGDDADHRVRICDECGDEDDARADCLACGRVGVVEIEDGTAAGGADAPTTAPAPDPAAHCASAASTPDGAEPAGSRASALSSLPAIHQPAAPLEVKLAGELERIVAHRGMVAGLNAMAESLKGMGYTQAAYLVTAAAHNWDIDEVLS